jgi:hypothetical protein
MNNKDLATYFCKNKQKLNQIKEKNHQTLQEIFASSNRVGLQTRELYYLTQKCSTFVPITNTCFSITHFYKQLSHCLWSCNHSFNRQFYSLIGQSFSFPNIDLNFAYLCRRIQISRCCTKGRRLSDSVDSDSRNSSIFDQLSTVLFHFVAFLCA